MDKFRPVDPRKSPRFAGIKTFMRLPNVKTTKDVDIAIIGVPFDTGASYRVGARFGPEAIRSVSALLRHHNEVLNVSIFDHCSVIDYGDLPVNPGYIEDSYNMIEEGIHKILEDDVVPILLGGDHSVTLPELRAVVKKHGPVALIQFDSHTDTGDQRFGRKYTHGTPFRRAIEEGLLLVEHSMQLGIRGSVYDQNSLNDSRNLGFDLITTMEIQEQGINALLKRVKDRVGDAKVFVSFDIDFVDPAYAPGTGTPEVGGLTSSEALRIVRGLEGLNFIGFDLVEVLPQYDPSHVTALLASNIVYEFMSLIALKKKLETEK
ncbi:MAG: agmatinase [Promethearchaeota archaeon]